MSAGESIWEHRFAVSGLWPCAGKGGRHGGRGVGCNGTGHGIDVDAGRHDVLVLRRDARAGKSGGDSRTDASVAPTAGILLPGKCQERRWIGRNIGQRSGESFGDRKRGHAYGVAGIGKNAEAQSEPGHGNGRYDHADRAEHLLTVIGTHNHFNVAPSSRSGRPFFRGSSHLDLLRDLRDAGASDHACDAEEARSLMISPAMISPAAPGTKERLPGVERLGPACCSGEGDGVRGSSLE